MTFTFILHTYKGNVVLEDLSKNDKAQYLTFLGMSARNKEQRQRTRTKKNKAQDLTFLAMSISNKEQRTKTKTETKNENKEQQSTISHLLGHEDEELFKLNQAAPVVVELLHHLLHLKKKDLLHLSSSL